MEYRYIVHTDADNYVIGLELDLENGIIVPEEVFFDQICWKFEDDQFIFDQEKKDFLIQKDLDLKKIEELKKFLSDTDYIYNSIREGGRTEEYYADVIEKRKAARKEIQDIEQRYNLD